MSADEGPVPRGVGGGDRSGHQEWEARADRGARQHHPRALPAPRRNLERGHHGLGHPHRWVLDRKYGVFFVRFCNKRAALFHVLCIKSLVLHT